MHIKTIHNYIHLFKFNLDKQRLLDSSEKIYQLVKENFSNDKKEFTEQSTLSTQLFKSYNFLLNPLDQVHELYTSIKNSFDNIRDNFEKKYYIQCWLNYYQKGDYIDWHRHFDKERETWHGFYCLDCEPSFTTYKLPDIKEEVNIYGEDNLMVISKSNGDEHRTWPWQYDRPRITIAFDIVPNYSLIYNKWLNHWIPI
jgi:hypothetical protein